MQHRPSQIAILAVIALLALAVCEPVPPSGLGNPPSDAAPQPTPATASGASAPSEMRFGDIGYTTLGEWWSQVVASPVEWRPGSPLKVDALLRVLDPHFDLLNAKFEIDGFVALVTAERTFDAEGHLRLPSDERMSTLVTVTSIGIEGGTQGAVSRRVGYPFRTPVDEMVTVPLSAARKGDGYRDVEFHAAATLPADLPPGLYRLRVDYGVTANARYLTLNADAFAKRSSCPVRECESELYSAPIPASAKLAGGPLIDASAIRPRIPWVLLANYNSNGYRGVVATEDQRFFALSSRNLIQDDVILPMYDEANPKVVRTYSLEPTFPADTITQRQNIPWDYTKGQLSIQLTQPDGKLVDLGTAPFVAKAGSGITTKSAKFTQWKPPLYGRYTVRATGWTEDVWGRRYEGGGTFEFWIAKRMTLATATFQGQAYPVGNRYGRDMGFSPAVPADVDVTATLFVNSDRNQARTITYSGKASAGGLFTAAEGLKPLPFDAPGEYLAHVLARYTDADGHLWVATMRHAGVVYPTDTPIVAHGKKIRVKDELVDRGETRFEGWIDKATQALHLDHINFPYNAGDVLLIAAEYQGANKIEPVLTWEYKTAPRPWDPAWQAIGVTNLRLQTSNGYSPHLFPEYITDRSYYYAAGARPGFMGRFLVGEDGTRAPYWPTTNTNFGGQINASSNGDAPGDIYRLIGGVVVGRQGQAPMYAGYIANAFILPGGSNNNRVIAPGSEELMGSTGERARVFLAMNARPGMVYEVGTTFAPAFQIDPIVPANMKFTLHYPDGRSVVASGVGDAGGSWAGTERWALDVPGMYRYTVESEWKGYQGIVPGIPKAGGAIYVIEKQRPPNAPGITFQMPPVSTFDPAKAVTFSGASSAKEIDYAMIIPGAVLAQGTIPVRDGRFTFTFDPASLHALAQTYDVKNQATGKAELADVVHLTFFSKETSPTTYHSFVRLIVRGNTVHYTR